MNQIAPIPNRDDSAAKDTALKSARVTKLLLSYPMAADDQFTMKIRLEAYLISVKGFHSSLVNEACERWLRAASGMPDANYSFPPNPSQLASLCDRIDDEERRARRASQPPNSDIPNKYREPKIDTARRSDFMADMKAKFGEHFGLGGEADDEAKKRRSVLNAQIKRASDTFLKREFEAAGLPIPPEGSLEVPPSLIRLLNAKKTSAA